MWLFLLSVLIYVVNSQYTAIECGDTVTGTLVDELSYDFTLDSAQYVGISTCDSDFDTVLSLYSWNYAFMNGSVYVSEDDDGCGTFGAGSNLIEYLEAGDYYFILEAFGSVDSNGESFEIVFECSDLPITTSSGANYVDADCSFVDIGTGPIWPIGQCAISYGYSVDAGAFGSFGMATSTMFTCNSDDNGIIGTIYNNTDCDDSMGSYELELSGYYNYNCDYSGECDDSHEYEMECGLEDTTSGVEYEIKVETRLNFMAGWCSELSQSKTACNADGGGLVLTTYDDDECTENPDTSTNGDSSFSSGLECTTKCGSSRIQWIFASIMIAIISTFN